MRTVLIELHGFSRSYISDESTPFISSLIRKYGVSSLQPPFGPDALTALFTGAGPDKHDQFFKFAYHGKKINLQKYLPYTLCNYMFTLYRMIRRYNFYTKLAPRVESGIFTVHKRYHYTKEGAFWCRTLFDLLRANGKTFLYYEHPTIATEKGVKLLFSGPGDDSSRGRLILQEMEEDKDFTFVLLRDADIMGHMHGPDSEEVRNALAVQDTVVKKIVSELDMEIDNLILMSSYGMVPVKGYIDLESQLPPFGDGYLYFLDSTFARFWFFYERKRQQVIDILSKISYCRILGKDDMLAYGIDIEHNQFGDLFCMVDYGYVISPDFFNKKRVKGMHTFDLSNADGNEFGMVTSNRKLNITGRLIDMMPAILDMMNIHSIK